MSVSHLRPLYLYYWTRKSTWNCSRTQELCSMPSCHTATPRQSAYWSTYSVCVKPTVVVNFVIRDGLELSTTWLMHWGKICPSVLYMRRFAPIESPLKSHNGLQRVLSLVARIKFSSATCRGKEDRPLRCKLPKIFPKVTKKNLWFIAGPKLF